MLGYLLCTIGIHQRRDVHPQRRSLHTYRECVRCLERSVRAHPLSPDPVDQDWLRGGAAGPPRGATLAKDTHP